MLILVTGLFQVPENSKELSEVFFHSFASTSKKMPADFCQPTFVKFLKKNAHIFVYRQLSGYIKLRVLIWVPAGAFLKYFLSLHLNWQCKKVLFIFNDLPADICQPIFCLFLEISWFVQILNWYLCIFNIVITAKNTGLEG